MSELYWRDCRIYHGGYDLTGKHNQVTLALRPDIKDRTTFLSAGAKQKRAGLVEATMSGGGFWDATGLDPALYDGVGVDDGILTFCPLAGVVADPAYFMKGVDSEFAPGGKIGDLVAFNFAALSTSPAVKGVIMDTGAKTTTAAGTARQVGAALAEQKLYAALHVFNVSGTGAPSLTVTIDSHDANTWDGSETERLAFSAMLAQGALWRELAGPITDTWYRASWTITGTNPSFLFCVSLGIL